MNKEIFGKHFKLLIKRANLTQEQLAEMTGFSVTSISKFANGHRLPAFDKIVPLARALRVTCDEFLMQVPFLSYEPIQLREGRFVLSSDDSGHEYLIPEDKSGEWNEFLDNPEMPYMDLPEWADRFEGDLIITGYING